MVDFVEWEDKYSVGIDEIDEQHKKLFHVTNIVIETYQSNTMEMVKTALKDLIDYACYHFAAEENSYLMNHPEVDKHQAEHLWFIEKVTTLYDNCMEEKNVSEELLDFLLSWIKKHILNTDQKHLADSNRS